MRILKVKIIVISTALLFSACSEDFLTKVDPNQLNIENFWRSLEQTRASIVACYSPAIHQAMYTRWGAFYFDGRSDELVTNSALGAYYDLIYFNDNDWATNYNLAEFWRDCYAGISRTNYVLENMHKTELKPMENPEELKWIRGEAFFLRAFYHYNLIVMFREVPMKTKVPENEEDYYLPKSPRVDVFQQIFTDLDSAINLLPESWDSQWLGKATRGAAYAHLGRAYMFHYGYDTKSSDQSLVIKAKEAFESIYGKYSLFDNYEDNFKIETEWGSESVYELNLAEYLDQNNYQFDQVGSRKDNIRCVEFTPKGVGGGWGSAHPSQLAFDEFYDTTRLDARNEERFGNRDPRKDATFCFIKPEYEDTMYTMPYSQVAGILSADGLPTYTWKKGLVLDRPAVRVQNTYPGLNIKEFRYSEVLLYLAECEAILGDFSRAASYINEVRDRVGLTLISENSSDWTLEKFMDQIEHERRTELCFEGKRWFDLLRWGKTDRIKELENSEDIFLVEKGRNFIPVKHDFFPIPEAYEIFTNPNITQDPNY